MQKSCRSSRDLSVLFAQFLSSRSLKLAGGWGLLHPPPPTRTFWKYAIWSTGLFLLLEIRLGARQSMTPTRQSECHSEVVIIQVQWSAEENHRIYDNIINRTHKYTRLAPTQQSSIFWTRVEVLIRAGNIEGLSFCSGVTRGDAGAGAAPGVINERVTPNDVLNVFLLVKCLSVCEFLRGENGFFLVKCFSIFQVFCEAKRFFCFSNFLRGREHVFLFLKFLARL